MKDGLDMKFPELFAHFNNDDLANGQTIIACFGDDHKEYKFDYTKIPESDKQEGETAIDTLTRLAKENPNCANVEINWYNTLWPELVHKDGIEILVMWAGWKENAPNASMVEHGMIQSGFIYQKF